jgi:hypothetical protein
VVSYYYYLMPFERLVFGTAGQGIEAPRARSFSCFFVTTYEDVARLSPYIRRYP